MIESVNKIFLTNKCHIEGIKEDIISSMFVLKNVWNDEKSFQMLEELSENWINQSFENCHGACHQCREKVEKLLYSLGSVGLDQALLALVLARKRIKNNIINNF